MSGFGSFLRGLSLPELLLVLFFAALAGGVALRVVSWLARTFVSLGVGLLLLYLVFRFLR